MLNFLFGFGNSGQAADNVHVVDAAEVKQWLAAGEAVLVDVREVNEFAAEHIPGAVLNPLSVFDPARLPPSDGRKLVIHCRSGSRCGMAAMRLVADGYTGEIHRMRGGILGWKAVGGTTVSGMPR
ncbi:MAG: rhodanese-like domain-containing protein [Rhodospirillales bacterium]|nr:rhodanese-like domain-containing protein [Rhodospirillales bacterium]